MTSQNERVYTDVTPRSASLFARAQRSLAGGVAGDVKMIKPYPSYIRRASGAYLEDVDGNQLLDMRMGASALILGHGCRPVLQAVRSQLEAGMFFSLPTELDAQLAERVCTYMPHVERLRLVNSGSEATIFAVRTARAITGRTRVAKFTGSFHGHANDALLVSTGTLHRGPPERPDSVAASAGLSPAAVAEALVLPMDDVSATVQLIEEHAVSLCAVIMEPVPVSGGIVVPSDRLLQEVRRVTRRTGVLLVFDEMITGFRLGLGGASDYLRVVPDLVTIGKVLGGGMPIGAFGGGAALMTAAVVGTGGRPTVRQSGTFSGHPLAMAAGIATLDELAATDPYPRLGRLGTALRSGLVEIVDAAGIDAQVSGIESMFSITFTQQAVTTRRAAATGDVDRHRSFCVAMMAHGVFMMPGQPGFLSTAHTEADIGAFLGAAEHVLRTMRADGKQQ